MCEQCEYCGEQMDFIQDSTDGAGWGTVDTSYFECHNEICLGEKEPSCFECGNYAWQVGEEHLIKHYWEGSEEIFCACCLEGYLNEEIAA
jgi:hypothetical protein